MLKKLIYRLLYNNKLVSNYFKTNHKKNVLISYVLKPFIFGPDSLHSNSVDSIEIAKAFDSLGYNVDVISYDSNRNLNYDKYDLIFGFGDPLINSFYRRNKDLITILFGTGMNVEHQNRATLDRLIDLYHRKKVWVPESCRIIERTGSIQTSLVDAMVLMGGDLVRKTFRDQYDGIIKCIEARYSLVYHYENVISNKNFEDAKFNFLWFGSSGAVHKGLDLLLEIFSKRKDINLYVCSNIKAEKRFCELYHEELFNMENIHVCGFVNVESQRFMEILGKCAFTILPSCSEGQATSVLTVMGNGGLIPLVTKQTGCYGNGVIDIQDISIESIENAITEALNMSTEEIRGTSLEIGSQVVERNSTEKFRYNFEKTIKDILCQLGAKNA